MNSGPMQMLYAQTVAHVKHFECFTPSAVVQPSIRHGAVNV